MKSKEVGAFVVETAKLTLKSKRAGVFTLNSQAVYLDDLGVTKTCKLQPFTIVANPPAPKERVTGKVFSGTLALDELLLGGIPENYAVALTAPSSDERTLLTQKFLKAGTEVDETTFYIAADPKGGKDLAEKYPSSFHFILCNPQADAIIQDAPNVYKLKSVENLTEIDIALTKFLRTLDTTVTKRKRACIEIVSDVLLQHHAVTTRKWLSALLPTLKNKGFTVLATVNPRMHPSEEVEAILSLFDGEISIQEKESSKGTSSFLLIKKMTGQNYLKNEIVLAEA